MVVYTVHRCPTFPPLMLPSPPLLLPPSSFLLPPLPSPSLPFYFISTKQIPRRMPNMIIRETRHREIRMIVALLKPDPHAPFPALCFRGRFLEIFGEKLVLGVEVVCCALCFWGWCKVSVWAGRLGFESWDMGYGGEVERKEGADKRN